MSAARRPVDAARVRAALPSPWSRVDVVATTGSTNADLLADGGAAAGRVLVTEHQSAGRGRLGRRWEAPPGSALMVSAGVRPDTAPETWGRLPLATGLALAGAVTATTGLAVGLKWPNDLLVVAGERKLAGILVQAAGDVVVIGVGCNVAMTRDELPVPGSTSLDVEGVEVDRTELLIALLQRLSVLLGTAATDPAGLRSAYLAACLTLGRDVRVGLAGDDVHGRAVDVDAAGALLLDTPGGRRRVLAGDVTHVRPA